jgi:hypothetical protein
MYRCTGDNKKPSHNATAARKPRGSREARGLEEGEAPDHGEALGGGGGGFVITLEVRAEPKKEKTKKGSKARFERKGE